MELQKRVRCLRWVLWMCLAFVPVTQGCIVTAPNVVRLGAEETIVVFNRGSPRDVTLSLHDHPARLHTLFRETISMGAGESRVVRVPIDPEKLSSEEIRSGQRRYVSLVVECYAVYKKEARLLISDKSGYLLLQSDKPIYTPKQTVNLRMIAVGEDLVPSIGDLKLEIKNPQSIVTYQTVLTTKDNATGMYSHSYKFPESPILGEWKAVVTYGSYFTQETQVAFQVEEYVLPTFSVTLTVPSVILSDQEFVQGELEAKYVYGKPVEGSASFTFKVRNEAGTDREIGSTDFKHADVKDLNGKPAAGIPCVIDVLDDQELGVNVVPAESFTDAAGRAAFLVQTERRHAKIKAKVQTRDPKYQSHQQSEGSITIDAFDSPVQAFVALERMDTRRSFMVGEYFDSQVITEPADISPVYYMVTHRGQTKVHGSVEGSGNNPHRSVHFAVTRDMSPRVRVLVYAFHRGHLIADSLTIQVEELCTESSNIKIEPDFRKDQPGSNGSLKVLGKSGTRVGILGVDKAVYILNNKGLLTREKLFKTLRSHELGCGPGGGLSSEEVISSFGVVVISEEGRENVLRTENSCEARVRRRRNVLSRAQRKYRADPFLKECCSLGMKPDRIGRRCSTRAHIMRRYMQGERGEKCAQAFEECCLSTTARPASDPRDPHLPTPPTFPQRVQDRERFGTEVTMDEIDGDESPGTMVRNDFRETWLFDEQVIGPDGVADFAVSLPHSITTWSVQAVSVSPTGGVCVPKAEEVRVFQPIFLQVALPYKVVRNEQIEVLVTVYNYGSESIRGNVYIYGVEGLCTGALPGERSERRPVVVEANSASSVTFPVIPLKEGVFVIKVFVKSSMGEDVVEKELNVVPEGVTVEKSASVPIDPTNARRRRTRSIKGELYQDSLDPGANLQVISVNTRMPPDAIPDTKTCSLMVIGNQLGPSVQMTLENIESLITMPTGCGEQTMMLMAPTLYALEYLKQNKLIDEALEEKGYRYIKEGYQKELSFRKDDGSFSAFTHRKSSVWLTAFVLRIFCKSRRYTHIDPTVIESGMLWLAAAQKYDGSYVEKKPIMHKIMLGGVRGSVPMTAFVLLTFLECMKPPSMTNGPHDPFATTNKAILRRTVELSQRYLRENAFDSDEPYVAALVAYALSQANDTEKYATLSALKEKLIYDPMLSTRSTGMEASPLVVEGTGYALLALLAHNDIETSKTVVNWLNTHRSASGSFASTQDTVVALEALTEFALKSREPNVDLTCNVTLSSKRGFQKSIRLKRDNAAILQQVDIHDIKGKMFVKASGTGSGLLSVKLKYNVVVPPEVLCKFNITVRADIHKPAAKTAKKFDDFPPELLEDLFGGGRRRRSVGSWFRSFRRQSPTTTPYYLEAKPVRSPCLRHYKGCWLPQHQKETRDTGAAESRRRDSPAAPFFPDRDTFSSGNSDTAAVSVEGPRQSKLTYDIEVCSRYIGREDSNMAVIEVGLFSGFKPMEKDLEAAREANNSLLAKYEMTEKNVILYFDKIPWESPTCVKFRIERQHVVYNVQSAVVKVYDYYNPMHSCSQFYGPGSTSPLLKLICENDQCQCAEAACPRKEPFIDVERSGTTVKKRQKLVELTCQEHDFVWIGMVSANRIVNGYRYIDFRVDSVVKEGAENSTSAMTGLKVFVAREFCNTADLTKGRSYFIFGRDSEPHEKDGEVVMRYVLDKNVRLFNTEDGRASSRGSRLYSVLMWLTSGLARQGGCQGQ
ncbi:hypothetical protein V5799_014095 [Amblyomma americanum]|uniref:Uncharacterized protein n=1 Tax=Amblyomma americanum TaxID=6943 RepID=A0AAQ4E415_AMBAM